MRKKVSVLLILALCTLLALSLFACNREPQDESKLPPTINPSVNEDDPSSWDISLKFYFTKNVSSVFKSLFIDEFNIADVEYAVVLTDGKTTNESTRKALSEDMVAEEDKAKLTTAGHHMINVTVPEGASGSFALHLQDRNNPTETVALTFVLTDSTATGSEPKNATALFGKTEASGNKVTCNIEANVVFNSWDDILETFPMTLAGKALSELKYGKDGKINATTDLSKGISVKTLASGNITTVWTKDVIKVQFELNKPEDATLADGCVDPTQNETLPLNDQYIARNSGKIDMPSADAINVFNGYYFSGWYKDVGDESGKYDENDKLWNFAETVGSEDIVLVAKWTQRTYSATIYTMGGVFVSDVKNSVDGSTVLDSDEKVVAAGYKLVSATTRFSLDGGTLNRIEFSGLDYGKEYSKYVAKVLVDAKQNKTVYMKITDVRSNLVKGDKEYLVAKEVCKDYPCQNPVSFGKVITDLTGYVNWQLNLPEAGDSNYDALYLSRLSRYYTEVVFKDGLSIKADGSIRIDRIKDETVNKLIIPKELEYKGKVRPVSEIAEGACMNLKGLVEIDMTEAENLTAIGTQAFAYCPALKTVKLPSVQNISSVGMDVFTDSTFENEYKQASGSDFIVLNNILYKYVGDTSVKTIDLSAAEHVTVLEKVTSIAEGAFTECTELEEITLSDGIVAIEQNAFANLTKLVTLKINKTSKLNASDSDISISDSAFSGCTALLSSSSSLYDRNSKAIIIGKLYYRSLATTATSVEIPDTVSHIAANAFNDCKSVETITFKNSALIRSIGKDAFNSTQWIKKSANGYTVVNGILAEYYIEKRDVNAVNIVLPRTISSISENAFGTYAQFIETLQFGDTVQYIDNRAFAGAAMLRSFIFSAITVDSAQTKLENAPYIEQDAFADNNGDLLNDANFYFAESVLTYLEALANGTKTTVDKTTLGWLQFYKLHKDSFVEEKVSGVWIDSSKVASNLVRKNKDVNAFDETYPNIIEGALVIMDNTGVMRYEDLDKIRNSVSYVLVQEDGEFAGYYEEGVTKYVVTFKYQNTTEGCHIHGDSGNLFVVTEHNAIAGGSASPTDVFYKSDVDKYAQNGAIIDISKHTSADNFWLEGFEGSVEDSDVPVFYTSNTGVTVKFRYKYETVEGTMDDGVIELSPYDISGFSTSSITDNGEAVFTVDFYGVGTYKFKCQYKVKESKYIAIEQTSAVSIPLNGTAKNMNKFMVELVGQDGNRVSMSLSTSNFTVVAVDGKSVTTVNTTTLGMHTISIKYAAGDAEKALLKTLVYFVVLEADSSMFTYEIIDEREVTIDSVKYAGTARITSCNAKSADTIVLPTAYTVNGNTYAVTEIGKPSATKGVFEDFGSLKAIYLSATIETINARSFANCTLLENIYTVQKVNAEKTRLTTANLEEVSSTTVDGKTVVEAKLKNIDGITLANGVDESHKLLAIDSQYVINGVTYKIVGVADGIKVDANTEVFLPNSIYNVFEIKTTSGESVTPSIYTSENGYMFRTAQYVAESVKEIGTSAFAGCTSLRQIDLSRATSLYTIGANAFEGSGLTSIDLTSNTQLQEINAMTFAYCLDLKEIKLASSVSVLASRAFYNCKALDTITCAGATVIAKDAFEGCSALANAPTV